MTFRHGVHQLPVKYALTKALHRESNGEDYEKSWIKVTAQQPVELPDDLTIPDFLRRSILGSAVQQAEIGQQSPPAPRVN